MAMLKTRRHQIAGFERECKLPAAYRARVRRLLEDAAMVGAVEERERTLKILSTSLTPSAAMVCITARSVLAVLGYEK